MGASIGRVAALAVASAACAAALVAPAAARALPRRDVSVRLDVELGRLLSDGAAACIGGAFGVGGTLAVYENNRFHAKQRVVCAYCEGAGVIKCGSCLGTGRTGDGSPCPVCGGEGSHVCVNCEATGLAIPPTMERKEIKREDDELERKLDEIGIAALADDIRRAENSPGDLVEVGAMLSRRALREEDIRKRASA